MSWAWQNRDQIGHLLVSHLYLALVPVVFGIIVAIPVGIMCVRWRWTWPPILSLTSIFYALPSLALYLVLIAYTGLTDWTVIIPLTLFSLSVLIPNVVDGLRGVPPPVRQAADQLQRVKVIAQRQLGDLLLEPDRRGDLGQHVVPGEHHVPGGVHEHHVPAGVPRGGVDLPGPRLERDLLRGVQPVVRIGPVGDVVLDQGLPQLPTQVVSAAPVQSGEHGDPLVGVRVLRYP